MSRALKCTKNVVFALVLLAGRVRQWLRRLGNSRRGANVPKNMKQYFLCLLEKGEKWTPVQFADPAMQEHLAFIREQVEAGKFVVVGPALDQGRMSGVAIINATSIEEAQKNCKCGQDGAKRAAGGGNSPGDAGGFIGAAHGVSGESSKVDA